MSTPARVGRVRRAVDDHQRRRRCGKPRAREGEPGRRPGDDRVDAPIPATAVGRKREAGDGAERVPDHADTAPVDRLPQPLAPRRAAAPARSRSSRRRAARGSRPGSGLRARSRSTAETSPRPRRSPGAPTGRARSGREARWRPSRVRRRSGGTRDGLGRASPSWPGRARSSAVCASRRRRSCRWVGSSDSCPRTCTTARRPRTASPRPALRNARPRRPRSRARGLALRGPPTETRRSRTSLSRANSLSRFRCVVRAISGCIKRSRPDGRPVTENRTAVPRGCPRGRRRGSSCMARRCSRSAGVRRFALDDLPVDLEIAAHRLHPCPNGAATLIGSGEVSSSLPTLSSQLGRLRASDTNANTWSADGR